MKPPDTLTADLRERRQRANEEIERNLERTKARLRALGYEVRQAKPRPYNRTARLISGALVTMIAMLIGAGVIGAAALVVYAWRALFAAF